VRSGQRKKQPKTKPPKKCSGRQPKKWVVVKPIWCRMKKRSPSNGQNGQLVHWWLLVHFNQTNPHDWTSSVWDDLVFIPIIDPPIVRKVESKKLFTHPPIVFFFSPRTIHVHPTTPSTHLPHSFCNGKTYISSQLNI
jgi:hypothetical protein